MCKIRDFILGESTGCLYKDKIVIEISPSMADTIANTFRELALKENVSYERQGVYREISDFFRKVFREWDEKRLEKDKKDLERKLSNE